MNDQVTEKQPSRAKVLIKLTKRSMYEGAVKTVPQESDPQYAKTSDQKWRRTRRILNVD